MKKITYEELKAEFFRHERNSPAEHLSGCIVFTEDSFSEKYSLAARTYRVSSDCKAFNPYSAGNSLFGSAIDGSDSNVRIDWYMADEAGKLGEWKIDYCYVEGDAEQCGDTPVSCGQ